MVSNKLVIYAIPAAIMIILGSAAVYSLSPFGISNEKEDPVKFDVYFFQYGGFVPPDKARLEFRIEDEGIAQVIWKDVEGQIVDVSNHSLTTREIELLKKLIIDNGFSELEELYTVPEGVAVIDAGVLEVGITIDEMVKEFIVNPNADEYLPVNIRNIIIALRQIISDTVENGQKTDLIGSIQGRVLDQKSQPLPGIRIGIVNGTTYFPEIGPVTNSLGEFKFPGLLPGKFTVAAYDEEGQVISQQVVEVMAGETTEVEFPGAKTPEKGNGSIIGKVVDKDGNPLVGVKVAIINGTTSYPKIIQVTNENGVFEFPRILQGIFVVATYSNGEIIKTESVTVEEGESSRIILEVSGDKDPESKLLKITWKKSGGFIGISETLLIDLMGYVTYNSNQLGDGDYMLTKQLTRREMGQLFNLINEIEYETGDYIFKLDKNVADFFKYNLTFYTTTGSNSIIWFDDWAIEEQIPKELIDLQDFIENITISLSQKVNSSGNEESRAIKIAKDFIISAPTYKFDGIADSVIIGDVTIFESYPVQYIILINFQSTHAGYGDREGQFLAQVITLHKAVVKVVSEKVVQVIIDGQWDELTQQELKPLINDEVVITTKLPESVNEESSRVEGFNPPI